MQDIQSIKIGSPSAVAQVSSFWFYSIISTLAFLAGVFVVWQVNNYILDVEINSSSVFKTGVMEKNATTISSDQQPVGEDPAGQE